SKPSINNIKSVPNGGLTAWLQVLGSFFLFWNTWGIINAFGTYQTYYESGLLASSPASDISWIGSLQATLLMLVGALSGPINDAGYVHHLLIIGSVLAVLGQMMLSLCTEYWQVFLAQAVCQGLGAGMLFVPSVSILSTYFSTKLATAVGLAASGSSLGGVVYPIVFHKLQPVLGFAWSTRVVAFIMLATLAMSNGVMKVRVLPAGRRKFIDLSAFKEPAYVCFVLGMTLCFAGLYEPFFYVHISA
ncbi:MFS general substrate transporter, partial [Teratosphaeria nubilosa]